MDNTGVLYEQFAAENECSRQKAQTVCFVMMLADEGLTVPEVREKMKLSAGTLKGYAREFRFSFGDYTPRELAQ